MGCEKPLHGEGERMFGGRKAASHRRWSRNEGEVGVGAEALGQKIQGGGRRVRGRKTKRELATASAARRGFEENSHVRGGVGKGISPYGKKEGGAARWGGEGVIPWDMSVSGYRGDPRSSGVQG